LVAIVLLATLVDGGKHAERAAGNARSVKTHRKNARIENTVGTLIATEDTVTGISPGRHNILRKQVREARTKEEEANVKDFAVPR
jgi:hypothetical protein